MRCVIYARYSSDLQRESSIEDQSRRCREYAERQGWTVVKEVADRAISGGALTGRDELQSLLSAARQTPRAFDRVLVDDTSRLSRNVSDVLTIIERLKYFDIHVNAVSQGIDSSQGSSRQLFTLNGMIDEQYVKGLADKVHRGQEGRALAGYSPGGKCYGYRNVPVEDSSRVGKYNRPAVLGVDLEIVGEEAATILRIFQMYAEGAGLGQIARKLNEDGVPSPQGPKTQLVRSWCPSSIRSMLRNERYRGVCIWNRTEKRRNPETGRKTSKRRPKQDWKRRENPSWRIVPEDLWKRVEAKFLSVTRTGKARSGGLARSAKSRQYMFSGSLICGCCGSHMVIVSGDGKGANARYGCPSHRYRGICSNRLTIRRDRLENQLLAALQENIWKPKLLDYAIRKFEQEIRRRRADARKASQGSDLVREREKLRQEASRVTDAIVAAGHSPALIQRLKSIESKLEQLDYECAQQKTKAESPMSSDVVRSFVTERMAYLPELARKDPEKAKAAFHKHLAPLVLTPVQRETGEVFEVSGTWKLVPELHVMPVVARDGIEPPTPAFSGLRTPKPI
jgi:site-specific DNA recombinase